MSNGRDRSNPWLTAIDALADVQNRVLADKTTGRGLAAIDATRVVTTRGAQLDSRLFGNRFQTMNWWAMKQSAVLEINRAVRFRDPLHALYRGHGGAENPEAFDKLAKHTRYLVSAIEDIDRDVERAIQNNQRLSEAALDWLTIREQITWEALTLLVLINDALDVGLLGTQLKHIRFRVSLRQLRAQRLREDLDALLTVLRKAERKVVREHARLALNFAITSIAHVYPPVALRSGTRTAILVGQQIVNWALGETGFESPAIRTLEVMSDEISKIETASRRSKTFTSASGKVFSVVSFVFDVQDVLEAEEGVAELQAMVNRADRALQDYLEDLRRLQPFIDSLHEALGRWETEMLQANDDVATVRQNFDSLRQQYDYYPGR